MYIYPYHHTMYCYQNSQNGKDVGLPKPDSIFKGKILITQGGQGGKSQYRCQMIVIVFIHSYPLNIHIDCKLYLLQLFDDLIWKEIEK